jgi:hypothetical protein
MPKTSTRPRGGDRSEELVESKAFDLNDPAQTNKFLSRDYADFYANRVEMMIGAEDVKLDFVHLLGIKDNKIQYKHQCSVTLSFQHARRVRDLLNRHIRDDDPRFKPIEKPRKASQS